MQIKQFFIDLKSRKFTKDLIACTFNTFVCLLESFFKEDVKSHTDVMAGDTEVKRNLTNSNIKH